MTYVHHLNLYSVKSIQISGQNSAEYVQYVKAWNDFSRKCCIQ